VRLNLGGDGFDADIDAVEGTVVVPQGSHNDNNDTGSSSSSSSSRVGAGAGTGGGGGWGGGWGEVKVSLRLVGFAGTEGKPSTVMTGTHMYGYYNYVQVSHTQRRRSVCWRCYAHVYIK
jgi:hypothetical protein